VFDLRLYSTCCACMEGRSLRPAIHARLAEACHHSFCRALLGTTLPLLERLASAPDVRPVLADAYGMRQSFMRATHSMDSAPVPRRRSWFSLFPAPRPQSLSSLFPVKVTSGCYMT
jgi:hypothetical protein